MKIKCQNCQEVHNSYLQPKIIPVSEFAKKDPWAPKYTVMIKASCFQCGKFIKFVKQNDDTINEVNDSINMLYKKLFDIET